MPAPDDINDSPSWVWSPACSGTATPDVAGPGKDWAEAIGPERSEHAWAFRGLQQAGAQCWRSQADWTVAEMDPLSPPVHRRHAARSAVTPRRGCPNRASPWTGRVRLHHGQRLRELLRGQPRVDHRASTPTSRWSPTTSSRGPRERRDAAIDMTIVGGEIVTTGRLRGSVRTGGRPWSTRSSPHGVDGVRHPGTPQPRGVRRWRRRADQDRCSRATSKARVTWPTATRASRGAGVPDHDRSGDPQRSGRRGRRGRIQFGAVHLARHADRASGRGNELLHR